MNRLELTILPRLDGGWLVRRALEERPDLFAGGVEVSGVLWRADGPNFLEQLPAALRAADRGFDPGALSAAGLAWWMLGED